ncbi:MAG: hypothetical protein IPH35_10580 [Rhodoferax sp.]|nr:hypothetical protein [Rhodoferax sp.]
MPKFDITARQFNAMRIGLEGKIDAIKERRPELIAEAESAFAKRPRSLPNLKRKHLVPISYTRKNGAWQRCKTGLLH